MFTIKEAVAFNKQNLVVDSHCHPPIKTYLFDYKMYDDHPGKNLFFRMQTDIPKLIEGGVDFLLSSAYLPEKPLIDSSKPINIFDKILKTFHLKLAQKVECNDHPGTPFEQTKSILKDFERKIIEAESKGLNVAIAKSKAELDAYLQEGKLVFLHSIEGGHSLGRGYQKADDYLQNLKYFFDEGVCSITLSHFFANDLVYPVEGIPESLIKLLDIKLNVDLSKGLTTIGELVVRSMLELGIIVDITHCTPKARYQVYDINKSPGVKMRPLILSHNGVKRICVMDDPLAEAMNPDDDEINKIKECNGVIGIILDNYWLFGIEEDMLGLDYNPGIQMVINTVKHIKFVTGSYDNIAIGSDYDGFTDPSDDLEDPSRFPYLTLALLNSGISEDNVKKILGLNIKRVLNEGWGK